MSIGKEENKMRQFVFRLLCAIIIWSVPFIFFRHSHILIYLQGSIYIHLWCHRGTSLSRLLP